MTDSERDLVAALRAELAAIDPARLCDRRAEIAGLGPILAPREPAVARLAVRLGGRAEPTASRGGRRRFRFDGSGDIDWEDAAEHCRVAWLRARFLARGSLSIAGGRTHLELVVATGEAPVLVRRLAEIGLAAPWRVRRGMGVVTWKSSEQITQFLGQIGASAGLLELEARGVARALRGELNRVLNAESANLQRSVAAAGRQLAAIDRLEADGRLAVQPRVVLEVAVARRETPEASLGEMAERLGLHRSTVQRALDRLERLALHDDGDVGRRWSGPGRGPGRGYAPRTRGRPGDTRGTRRRAALA